MASTPTPRNRFNKQGTGDNTGTWGVKLNDEALEMVDEAIDGMTSIAISGNVTLTSVNYTTDQARKRILKLTGSPGVTYKVTIPSVEKFYIVHNATDVTQNIGAAGSAASLVSGAISGVYCDGTNTYAATLASIVPLANGGTGASDAANARQNLGLGGSSAVSFLSVAASSATIPIITAGTSVSTNNLTASGTVSLGTTSTGPLTVSGAASCGALTTTTINTQSNTITAGAVNAVTLSTSSDATIAGNVLTNQLRSAGGNAGRVGTGTGSNYVVFDDTGSIYVNAVFVKTFVIDHPQHKDRYLVHACLEGPENGVYYTGEGRIGEDQMTQIDLPSYFSTLVDEFSAKVQVTPIIEENTFPYINTLAATRVYNGSFRVFGKGAGSFYWQVTANRKDVQPLEVEPLKSATTVHGDGPYRYIVS
jgi:hypothetical protein